MSIQIMSWVWKTSPSEGRELLVELALADAANDDGECWLAIETTARKARCSGRHVQASIRKFLEQKRIEIDEGTGPHGVNVYRFVGATISPRVQAFTPQPDTPRGEITGSEISPKSSGTVLDPTSLSLSTRARIETAMTELRALLPDYRARFPNVDAEAELEKASDWLLANGKTKKDYPAFFRNWLRRAEVPRNDQPTTATQQRFGAHRREPVAAGSATSRRRLFGGG